MRNVRKVIPRLSLPVAVLSLLACLSESLAIDNTAVTTAPESPATGKVRMIRSGVQPGAAGLRLSGIRQFATNREEVVEVRVAAVEQLVNVCQREERQIERRIRADGLSGARDVLEEYDRNQKVFHDIVRNDGETSPVGAAALRGVKERISLTNLLEERLEMLRSGEATAPAKERIQAAGISKVMADYAAAADDWSIRQKIRATLLDLAYVKLSETAYPLQSSCFLAGLTISPYDLAL
jgi:hypothetical protein